MKRSAALQYRRQLARERGRARAIAERVRSVGLTVQEYETAIAAAYLSWCVRWPWCWLPSRARDFTFARFGRRHSARIIAQWGAE